MLDLAGAAALTIMLAAPAAWADQIAAPPPATTENASDGPAASTSEVPPDLKKMLDAAIASGNRKDIDTIARYIVKVAPDCATAVNLAVAEQDKEARAARHDRLASQRFFDAWKGEGQLGASQSSGNTNALGINAGLTLQKEGLHWRHKLLAHIDYQRTDGLISRNQMRFSYEPNYKFDGNMFAFGLAQIERDPFSGFDARYSVSGGLGYSPVRSRGMQLDLKAGPAWRLTDYAAAPSDAQLSLLAGANYKWRITKMLAFSQTADVVLDSGDKTILAQSALDTRLGGKFSARFSWQYNFESDPPAGKSKVDTLSRVSLVYGF